LLREREAKSQSKDPMFALSTTDLARRSPYGASLN
jgi:hypothetical protein